MVGTAEPAARIGRGWNITLWVLQVITAGWFLSAALAKFSASPMVMPAFAAIGLGAWFRYLIAVLEIAGVVAMFVPRLTGLAASAFVLLLIGATLTQALAVGEGALTPLPLLVLSAIIAYGRRGTTARLWTAVTRRGPGVA
ncbi:MAG TPA: DoxX family protein [Streptosporangiaceae bacterium]|jgi:hypothetical protein